VKKEEFESAISAYTDKIVDEDSQLVKYVMTMSIKKDIIDRQGDVIARELVKTSHYKPKSNGGAPFKAIVTPLGRFNSTAEAARAHGITIVAMRGKIAYSKKCGYRDFYTE
jgi:hypothetical protein